MDIQYGKGTTQYGPGVSIDLEADEVARAIHSWIVGQGVHIDGARTIMVNGELIDQASIYVDPSGFVIANGKKFSGRG